MSITLYLINKKGYEILKFITCNEIYVKSVYCIIGAKDKGNQEDFYAEIKDLCAQYHLQFYDKNDEFVNKSDYSIAIGWRWLIQNVDRLIVIHDSYLPKYRGFSPIVNMLINGENYLAASAIWASENMDEGDIIAQKKINIEYPIKIQDAIELVCLLYIEIIKDIFQKLSVEGNITRTPQINIEATYSIWRDEEDYFINWNDDAKNIVRFVNAVGYPYGGAKTRIYGGNIIKVLECSVVNNIKTEIPAPGKILMIKDNPIVLSGRNAVSLDKIEDLNGNPFKFKKFRTRLF